MIIINTNDHQNTILTIHSCSIEMKLVLKVLNRV